jgi:hypothetical protein
MVDDDEGYQNNNNNNNNKKHAQKKPNTGKEEVNEYPRQGNQDVELGLVGEKGVEEVAEKEGVGEGSLGKDAKKSMSLKGEEE